MPALFLWFETITVSSCLKMQQTRPSILMVTELAEQLHTQCFLESSKVDLEAHKVLVKR